MLNNQIIKERTYLQTYLAYMFENKFSVHYNDYRFFSTKELPLSDSPYMYDESHSPLRATTIDFLHKGQKRTDDMNAFLQHSGTTALLIIKDDKLVYEQYFIGHERKTPQRIFSITKSFISALIGIAINQKFINSVDDLVTSYLPEFQMGKMNIKQLLQMDAGIKYKEGHFPWRDEARVYLHPDARKLALSAMEDKNKGFFHYNDYHLLLLGLILERATLKSVTEFFYENLWSKLGMQYSGYMILDSKKNAFEKIESGLVMTAIDLAKFGSLYLKKGYWEGTQIISNKWVEESVSRDNVPSKSDHFRYYHKHPWGRMWFRQNKAYYKYLWWGHLNNEVNNDYFALGALGQVLYISPENNAVAIRLGKKWGVMDWWPSILFQLIKKF